MILCAKFGAMNIFLPILGKLIHLNLIEIFLAGFEWIRYRCLMLQP